MLTGETELTEYLFNTRKNQNLFCRHCGVRCFGIANETPYGRVYGVNLGCLVDLTDEELSKIPITYVDGLHDKWQSAPEFYSHM
ncbi:hypothetical protein D3C81_2095080 [compost metagenome]